MRYKILNQNEAYFLTLTVVDWIDLFTRPALKDISNSLRLWQHDNHPIEVYSPKVIRQKLVYIHLNPVVDKIVALPEHYLYSSASNYLSGEGILNVDILEDFPFNIK